MGSLCSSRNQQTSFDEISQNELINKEGRKQPCKPPILMKFGSKDLQKNLKPPNKQQFENNNPTIFILQQEITDINFLDDNLTTSWRQQKKFQELDHQANKSPRSYKSTESNFNVPKNRKKKSRSRGKVQSTGKLNYKNKGGKERRDVSFCMKNKQEPSLKLQKKLQYFPNINQDSHSPKSILRNPSDRSIKSRSLSQKHVSFFKRK